MGYHARRSSVVISGTDLRRPWGFLLILYSKRQIKKKEKPSFEQSLKLDFELEIGVFLGGPENNLGDPINIKNS